MLKVPLLSFQTLVRAVSCYAVSPEYHLSGVITLPTVASPQEMMRQIVNLLSKLDVLSCTVERMGDRWALALSKERCKACIISYSDNADYETSRMTFERIRSKISIRNGCLFSATLIRHKNCFLLFYIAHHIIFDGESIVRFESFIREGVCNPERCTVPQPYLPILLAQTRAEDESDQYLSYWQEYIRGLPTADSLPAQLTRQTLSSEIRVCDVADLDMICDQEGVTQSIFLHWIIQNAIQHCNFPHQLSTFGVPFSLRGASTAIGTLINVLPISCQSGVRLKDGLQQLRQTYLNHRKRKNFPMLSMLRQNKALRGSSSALYNCVYTYLGDAEPSAVQIPIEAATAALEIDAFRSSNGYNLRIRSRSDVITESALGDLLEVIPEVVRYHLVS